MKGQVERGGVEGKGSQQRLTINWLNK
jgi:hypothetical protein